ncbi:hypothetical protein J6590_062994 [Homalodisca vitripennis]|nr:hypothetical protein J6590_062994 [Homalodisca vitripennis]
MFADDAALLLSDSTPGSLEVSAHVAMEMAVQYCHNNSLMVNESKCKQLVVGRRKEEMGVLPNIESSNETKYLGLYVVKRVKSISVLKTATTAAGLQPRETCGYAFIELRIITVVFLYILQVIMYAYNKNLTRDLHTNDTRRAADFTLPVHRTALFSEKPSYMGSKLFNFLPENIKSQSSSDAMKRVLRR